MRLLFKQKLFSWFDSYDIFDEAGNKAYREKGQLSWGHCLKIFDPDNHELGMVKERVLTLMPKFELYLGGTCQGSIRRELTVLKPKYDIAYYGWHMEGNILEWDYRVVDGTGACIAVISKELLHLTDTYVIEVPNPDNALKVLMLVLAVDAEKCSRSK